jgi:hypothetical protein
MIKGWALIFFLGFITTVEAQKPERFLKGRVIDSSQGIPVDGATISIVKAEDSSLVKYLITGEKGLFSFSGLAIGNYRLLINHVNYVQFISDFALTADNPLRDLKDILLSQRTNVLEGVQVKTETPPVMLKGDTTEFNANSFKTIPNAAVEDLLKKLPGIKVDKDGTIKLNGEKISNLLVDGKKFFGGSPKTATRNLPADAIDKVQIFDKISDQAQLSGFDDGKSTKTINLTFKKDHKKGSFGKLTAGYGTQGRYTVKANVNRFTEGVQFSIIGAANNINDDIASSNGVSDFFSFQNKNSKNDDGGAGRLTVDNSIIAGAGTGINYNNFSNTKKDWHGDYLYSYSHPVSESNTTRQFFLPDTSWLYQQQQQAWNVTNTHSTGSVYEKKFNEYESIKIGGYVNWQSMKSASQKQYLTLAGDGTTANDGYSNNNNDRKAVQSHADIIFRKRFLRAGRTISLLFSIESTGRSGTGQQLSENRFYRSGALAQKDTIDQQSSLNSSNTNYSIRTVFTESLFKSSLLEFSAGTSFSGTRSKTENYNFDKFSGRYSLLNTTLSNAFKNSYANHTTGLRMRIEGYKTTLSFGAVLQQSELYGEIIGPGKLVLRKSFFDVLPNAGYKYAFSRYRNLKFSYTTSINAPSSYQLQPVVDISDPLNKTQGNPDLDREYNHLVQFSYRSVHPYNGTSLSMNVTYQGITGKIISSDSTNSFGIRKSMPVNINGTYSVFTNLDVGFKIPWLQSYISVGIYSTLYKNKILVNGIESNIINTGIGPEWKITSTPSENSSLTLYTELDFSKAIYSIQPSAKNHFTRQLFGADFSCQLPGKWLLATEFTYTINSGLASGYNISIPLLNASVSRFILNNNRGELRLSVSDLFDRNTAVTRLANQNFTEDTHTKVLRRYFLLGFTYSLSRVGLSPSGSSQSNNLHLKK